MTTYTVKVNYKTGECLSASWTKLTRAKASKLVSSLLKQQYDRPENIAVETVRET